MVKLIFPRSEMWGNTVLMYEEIRMGDHHRVVAVMKMCIVFDLFRKEVACIDDTWYVSDAEDV